MKIGHIWIISILLAIISFAIWDWYSNQAENQIEIVECYDKENNEIIGLECEEESLVHLRDMIIITALAIIFSITGFFSMIGILFVPRMFNEDF